MFVIYIHEIPDIRLIYRLFFTTFYFCFIQILIILSKSMMRLELWATLKAHLSRMKLVHGFDNILVGLDF